MIATCICMCVVRADVITPAWLKDAHPTKVAQALPKADSFMPDEMVNRVCIRRCRCMGARGTRGRRMWSGCTGCRVITIYEGTSEVQRMIMPRAAPVE